jgi:hypothetical protein
VAFTKTQAQVSSFGRSSASSRACARSVSVGSRGRRGAPRHRLRRESRLTVRAGGPWWHVVTCRGSRKVGEWGRLVMVAIFAFILVVLVGLFGMTARASSVPTRTAVVQVRQGDTLWSLAHRFAPSGDPQAVVRRIVELNALEDSAAHVGQSLAVPTSDG